MLVKRIAKLLENALLHDCPMAMRLYEFEFAEDLDKFRHYRTRDNDDFLFSVTENDGDVAMILLEKSGEFHINEQARGRLKELWLDAYESNLKMLIPSFAAQLVKHELPINGVKTMLEGIG